MRGPVARPASSTIAAAAPRMLSVRQVVVSVALRSAHRDEQGAGRTCASRRRCLSRSAGARPPQPRGGSARRSASIDRRTSPIAHEPDERSLAQHGARMRPRVGRGTGRCRDLHAEAGAMQRAHGLAKRHASDVRHCALRPASGLPRAAREVPVRARATTGRSTTCAAGGSSMTPSASIRSVACGPAFAKRLERLLRGERPSVESGVARGDRRLEHRSRHRAQRSARRSRRPSGGRS